MIFDWLVRDVFVPVIASLFEKWSCFFSRISRDSSCRSQMFFFFPRISRDSSYRSHVDTAQMTRGFHWRLSTLIHTRDVKLAKMTEILRSYLDMISFHVVDVSLYIKRLFVKNKSSSSYISRVNSYSDELQHVRLWTLVISCQRSLNSKNELICETVHRIRRYRRYQSQEADAFLLDSHQLECPQSDKRRNKVWLMSFENIL